MRYCDMDWEQVLRGWTPEERHALAQLCHDIDNEENKYAILGF